MLGMDVNEVARHNCASILRWIRWSHGISRTELAERLDLTRAPIGKMVDRLLDAGLLHEEATTPVQRGRPRVSLGLNPDWAHVIVLSLHHQLSAGVVDVTGRLVHSEVLGGDDDFGLAPIPQPYGDRFGDLCRHAVSQLAEGDSARHILGIGIGSIGRVDRRGVIRWNGELPVRDVCMAEELAPVTPLPVFTDDELRLLLLGKLWDTDMPSWRSAVVMSARLFGHGGGHAVCSDGHTILGARGFAGTPGDLFPTLHTHDFLRSASDAIRRMGGKRMFLERVKAGDPAVMPIYRKVVENYGFRLALLANFYDPDIIWVYAPYRDMGDVFLDQTREVMQRHVDEVIGEHVKIEFGGDRGYKEQLTAAAVPVLARMFVEGLIG